MKKKTLLIFDDEDDILDVLNSSFQDTFNVITSNRIKDIICQVNNANPDIILMDHWIPDIGGKEAIIRLKKENTTKDIPVVVFTAYNDITSIMIDTKADGFVAKPFDVYKLKEYLEQY